ncbi:MAG: DnaA/Hda family protein [Pseudomonadota bacterium]
MPEQLSFPLPRRDGRAAGDFHVGEGNRDAVDLIRRRQGTDGWPGGKLLLCGPEGSGKTHLAHIEAAETGAALMDARAGLQTQAQPAVIVDNADAVAGDPAAEEALFHLHNNQFNTGGTLLMTARTRPGEWGVTLPDLASRMMATTVAKIGAPDDQTLRAIVIKLLSDRQLKATPDVIDHLVAHMDRRYASPARLVAALDETALASGRAITRAMAARVLDADRRGGA